MPRSIQTGTTLLKLLNSSSDNFNITFNDIPQAPQDLQDAISRTMSRLYTDNLQRLIVGRGANDSAALAKAPSLARLTLALTSNSPPIKSIMEEATKEITIRSESYSLTVPDTDKGVATLTANSSLGLFYGLITFEQLCYEVSGIAYLHQAPVQIIDFPAFVRVPLFVLYDYQFILFLSYFVAVPRVNVGYGKELVSSSYVLIQMYDIILISFLQFSSR